ncbi:MAG: DNA pilot protein [Microvirus sp.]|nr:MAG: DNA pilot protein [Microvirus sp.]
MSYDDSDNPAPWLLDAGATAFGLPPGLGSLVGGILGFQGGKDTNQANAAMAQQQMDFQERMSNTAHQRETKDLIAAGLNPMLSAMKTGATTPPGAMATMQNATAAGVSSAAQAASIENTKANTDQVKAQTDLIRAQTPEAAQRIATGVSTAGHLDAQAAEIRQNMTSFEDRWTRLKEEIELLKEQSKKTASDTDLNVQAFQLKVPAEIAQMTESAKKMMKESQLLGLKVPEAVQEAAFWSGPQGAVATHYKHAPTMGNIIPGTLTKGAEELTNLGPKIDTGVNSAMQNYQQRMEASRQRSKDRWTPNKPW